MVGSSSEVDLVEELGSVANVFLLAPTFSADVDGWCDDLLTCGSGGSLIYVVSSTDLSSYLDVWGGECATHAPERTYFLVLGGASRASSETGSFPGTMGGIDVVVRTVDSPGNLTKIGVEINQILDEATADGTAPGICFETLTPLIQYSDVEKVYKFLHVFTNQVVGVGAKAHYHLDPSAHEPTDVNLLKTNFDAIVEPADDGSLRIRTR